MKVLRIRLTQNKAHYHKEESLTNKMTYPLPPFSTVIGALHNACRFREYKPMDLSIQGSYKSLIKQPYTDYCFLDSVMDDRGILIKLKNSAFQSTAFEKVASVSKSQGSSFRKDITVQIHNKELIKEYRDLKNLNDKISEFKATRIKKFKETVKRRKQNIKVKKTNLDKKSDEFIAWTNREKEITFLIKEVDRRLKEYEFDNYTSIISNYQSLTTSLRFYEILHEVELVIHIKADEEIIKSIEDNIYNLKAIGRSEDFVDVKDCVIVELHEDFEDEIISQNSAYIKYEDIKNGKIHLNRNSVVEASGTKYWLNKNYDNSTGKRLFSKKKVVYASNYAVEEGNENIYLDGNYIVNFS